MPLDWDTRRPARAIYGIILATALIATFSEDAEVGPIKVAIWVMITALVFWLAHVYSEVLATGVGPLRHGYRAVLAALWSEFPLIEGAALPAAVMLLAPIGLVSAPTAESLAIAVGLGSLILLGIVLGIKRGLPLRTIVAITLINASFGLIVVGLKIVIH